MSWEPVVHCRQCNEALDVYVAKEERFCSEECAEEFEKANACDCCGKKAVLTKTTAYGIETWACEECRK